jgi:hypothetical protein
MRCARLLLAAVIISGAPGLRADGPAVGVVSNVRVLSDKVEDVSSLGAWQRSFIKDGMSGREKALAVWKSVVKFRHQDAPPREYLQAWGGHVQDPIKTFNVYGYGMCSCASSNIEALARAAGLQARGWAIAGHSVPEVSWDGGKTWHMLDASLIAYYPQEDGHLAGVEELVAGVREWYGLNPKLRKNDAGLRRFMAGGGWRKGPAVLSRCPFYDDNGWLPAATHGWYATMQELDCKPFQYEYGYSQGYRVNVQLRKGERLTRNWSNKGLHVNMGDGEAPGCLNGQTGKGDQRYTPRYGDLGPGRVGNGTLVYDVPLADGSFRLGALEASNLAGRAEDGQGPALHVKDAGAPGVLVLRLPSSYVYLGGELTFRAAVGAGGNVAVLFSDNHGLDWKEVVRVTEAGEQRVDLKPLVFRRYDYRLKFVLTGAGTGLDALRIAHEVQHSQRALPALAQGKNVITCEAGPPEGTITVEGSTDAKARGKQLLYTDFHPQSEGLQEGPLRVKGGQGQITFPVATPGDLVRLRFGAHYRARDARDGWDMQVSFDGGKTFATVGRCAGPTAGSCRYVTVSDVPPLTRRALVRFAGSQRNTTCLFDFRIDADYREPHGGLRPVKVTYRWDEGGKVREDVHVLRKGREQYAITCAAKPVMKSVTVEWAE